MFKNRLSIASTVGFVAIGALATYGITQQTIKNRDSDTDQPQKTSKKENEDSANEFIFDNDYKFTKPILLVKKQEESKIFTELKLSITNQLSAVNKNQNGPKVSVFLMDLTNGEWLSVNPEEKYHPASLLKVPLLLTFLKESETDSNILKKKILYDKIIDVPEQTYENETIKLGNTYTVQDLLKSMVVHSDNVATNILNKLVKQIDFKKSFFDFHLPVPELSDEDKNYVMDARAYSDFFLVLYYATYVTPAKSEYALSLLSQSDFKIGLVKSLPAETKVARKFGEWGDANTHELHESGIVYLNDKPYLITIMTRADRKYDLAGEISTISKMVYDEMPRH